MQPGLGSLTHLQRIYTAFLFERSRVLISAPGQGIPMFDGFFSPQTQMQIYFLKRVVTASIDILRIS